MTYKQKIIKLIFSIGIILFFIGFNFRDIPQGGWQLQVMPDLNGKGISDVYFLDSLNGWAVTPYSHEFDTVFVLKTTNGGDNWNIVNTRIGQWVGYNKIKFLNSSIGFTCGSSQASGYKGLNKSTDGGITWFSLNVPDVYLNYLDMSILNEDTIWIISSESLTGGVFRTTNGGQSWTQQLAAGNQNPDKIYMYNARIGFIVKNDAATRYLRKTTNGGENWFVIMNEGFNDMYFIDSLTGWKCWSTLTIKKTTDGGYNWITYNLPPESGGIGISMIQNLHLINPDTIWGVGAFTNRAKALIYLTTNGGVSWGYQLPDTNQINIYKYYYIQFYNKLKGWSYSLGSGVHTTTGGDTTIYTGIENKIISKMPKKFELYQNYPNPFNQSSIINVRCSIGGVVKLKVYDINGKVVKNLIDEYKAAGTYSVRFDAGSLSSGIYFYSLIVDGIVVDTKKAILTR